MSTHLRSILVGVAFVCSALATLPAEERPTDFVDAEIGARIAGGGVARRGNQTVSATAPYGMIQAGASQENVSDPSFDGFHLNIAAGNGGGGGMGFIGKTIPVAAALEAAVPNLVNDTYVENVITWDFQAAEPGYQRGTVTCAGNAVTVEIVARPRYALFRLTRPTTGPLTVYAPHRYRDSRGTHKTQTWSSITTAGLEGYVNYKGRVYWSYQFPEQADAANAVGASWHNRTEIIYAVAISSVSEAGARGNLPEVLPDFAAERAAARADWDQVLGRITLDPNTDAELQTKFYTALSRVLTYPQIFSDSDGRYQNHGDGSTETLPADWSNYYCHFSSWDTYRIHSPLMALLDPAVASDQARSMLQSGRDDGVELPKWGLWAGDAGYMDGNPSSMIVAWSFLLGANGFSIAENDFPMLGARQLTGLVRRPAPEIDHGAAAFTLSRLARKLGFDAIADAELARSERWWQIWNPDAVEPPLGSGGIRPRDADGNWLADGRTGYGDGSDYVEAEQADTQWLAHWDLAELVQRMGSTEVARARLDRYFWDPELGKSGKSHCHLTYNGRFSLYNQPVYSIPWTWGQIGDTRRQVDEVHRIVNDDFLTTATPDAYPGNDDLGSTSAWLVWSVLGLYPYWPGVPVLAVNAPMVEHAELQFGGKTLTISRSGTGTYVDSVTVNGEALTTTWVPVARLLANDANTIAFTMAEDGQWGMGSTPPNWRSQTVSAPNALPAISGPASLNLAAGAESSELPILVYDLETSVADLTLDVTSSDPALLPSEGLILGGSLHRRTLTCTAGPGAGTASLTLTVTDGEGASAQHVLRVVVGSGGGSNQAPVISTPPVATPATVIVP